MGVTSGYVIYTQWCLIMSYIHSCANVGGPFICQIIQTENCKTVCGWPLDSKQMLKTIVDGYSVVVVY